MAVAIAKVMALSSEQGLGLFYTACVPGGGAGHIMVSIIGGDHALSVSINFISSCIAIGKYQKYFLKQDPKFRIRKYIEFHSFDVFT